MLIGLSVRLGISIREVEQFDIKTIREYLAMFREMAAPEKPAIPKQQTPEEFKASFEALFRKP